jgi:hypothetical protein
VVGLVVVTQLLLCLVALAVVVMDSYRLQRAVQLPHLGKVMRVVMDGLIPVSQAAVAAVLVLLVVALLQTQTWVVRVQQILSLVLRSLTLVVVGLAMVTPPELKLTQVGRVVVARVGLGTQQ